MVSLALVCGPWTYFPKSGLEIGKEVAINLIQRGLYISQFPNVVQQVSIH